MPVQQSPPVRQTRAPAFLTPTPRAPLDGTSEAPQLRAHLDRGPVMEEGEPSRKEGKGPRRSSSFSTLVGAFPVISRTTLKLPDEGDAKEEENSVEEEDFDSTEAASTPVGVSQGTGGPTLSQYN
ncbi:hypothetical protein O181_071334 [Austropuccinia psidii MF-1]|uniref:Uncharacterized protein n=1 Tax=Austropuccinia psidii MF-1 TaxID=1389203 RepID=A0A9Q3F304_9BASI|nr:hypothetical protein [Austropuccinia psidii MF-1]